MTMIFLEEPPEPNELTEYDQQHLELYVRLLDAVEQGADWTDVARVLFGLEPNETARLVYERHLARAKWMSEHGYRHLVRLSQMH